MGNKLNDFLAIPNPINTTLLPLADLRTGFLRELQLWLPSAFPLVKVNPPQLNFQLPIMSKRFNNRIVPYHQLGVHLGHCFRLYRPAVTRTCFVVRKTTPENTLHPPFPPGVRTLGMTIVSRKSSDQFQASRRRHCCSLFSPGLVVSSTLLTPLRRDSIDLMILGTDFPLEYSVRSVGAWA